MYFRKHEHEVKAIMRTCGLSAPQCACLSGYLSSLERNSGIKCVVNILKDRFNAIIEPDSDTFKKKDGYWVGPFRPLSVKASQGKKKRIEILRLLRMHSIFRALPASEKDYRKAQTKLASRLDYTQHSVPRDLPLPLIELANKIRILPDDTYPMSAKKAPMGYRTIPEVWALPIDHIRSMDSFPHLVNEYYNYFAKLVGRDMPKQEHFAKLCRFKRSRSKCFVRRNSYLVNDCAGRVTILNKDGSCKHRLVANANRLLQLACSPVHNATMAFLKSHPQSFCYDQEGGVDWISQQLQAGYPLSSIDLTQASDNIPLDPQIRLLEAMFPSLSEPLNIFYKVSRMSFLTPYPRIKIKWTCGSPMGVKGSFGSFTFFIVSLFESIGGSGRFAVVGDDIVCHSSLTKDFLALLSTYDIPISTAKSLIDHFSVAEFCGKLITKEGSMEVYKGLSFFKTRDVTLLLRRYGPRALRWFPLGNLTSGQLAACCQFFLLEQTVLKELMKLIPSKPDLVVDGGLSVWQISSILDLDEETIQSITLKKESISQDQKLYLRIRLHSLSLKAIKLVKERKYVDAWKFALNDPEFVDFTNFMNSTPAARRSRSRLVPENSKLAFESLQAWMSDIADTSATDVLKSESLSKDGEIEQDTNPLETRIKYSLKSKVGIVKAYHIIKSGLAKLLVRYKNRSKDTLYKK